ncbi:MAG: 2'-5' RNA ligase family protein [Desulfobulbaceae bacterium]|jgi:2'-5' RNA ligase|nr:2'-5' RNA ligase family protein [Desulfobulbaceae bacterium]
MLLRTEEHIIAHQLRDFPEWHQGVSHYGIWCVMLDEPLWLRPVAAAQAHVRRLLHPGYRRQPHITLFAGGLLAARFFSDETLARQRLALTNARIQPFRLQLPGHLDSFATAPHLPVVDCDGGLANIRALLAAVAAEDSPGDRYHPHITLGFYRTSVPVSEVAARLRVFSQPPVSWTATSLSFCRFATADTQGPLETVFRLPL